MGVVRGTALRGAAPCGLLCPHGESDTLPLPRWAWVVYRFEKLDITPKSAQKLKPVLEKWLNEAELRNQEGQQNLMEFVGGEPSKKRKRRTSFTPQAIEALNAYFEKNPQPHPPALCLQAQCPLKGPKRYSSESVMCCSEGQTP